MGWGEGGAAITKTTSCIADGLGNNGDISVACRHYSGQYFSNFLSRIHKEYGESIVLWLIKIIHELVMDNTKVFSNRQNSG